MREIWQVYCGSCSWVSIVNIVNSLHPQFYFFTLLVKKKYEIGFDLISLQKRAIFVYNMNYFSIHGKQSGKVLDASISNIGKKLKMQLIDSHKQNQTKTFFREYSK